MQDEKLVAHKKGERKTKLKLETNEGMGFYLLSLIFFFYNSIPSLIMLALVILAGGWNEKGNKGLQIPVTWERSTNAAL